MYNTRGLLGMSLALTALSGACDDDNEGSSDVAVTAASPSADFTSYHSFALSTPDDVSRADIPADVESNLAFVNEEIADELRDRGLTEVRRDQDPDLVVFNVASTSDQAAVYWDCVDGYWYGYWAYTWDPCAWIEPEYTEYTAGTIALGLVDPDLREVVFGGFIYGVDYDGDQSQIEERIEEGVDEVFDAYPADQTGD